VALAKTLVRRDGLRVASSESHLVAQRIGAHRCPPRWRPSCGRCSRCWRP
jgi:hypothetical protein